MLAHKLHHREHADTIRLENRLERVVAQNLSLIRRVLQVLVLDVRPTGFLGREEGKEEKVSVAKLARRVKEEKKGEKEEETGLTFA